MARQDFMIERMKQSPMFAFCSKRELHEVSRLATEVAVPAGKELMAEGQPGYEFMVVLDGSATATREGKHVATFGPGDFFGEISLLDDGPRTATVTATTPMTLAVVGRREFTGLLTEIPEFAHKVMVGLARRLREVDERVAW